MSVCVSVVAAAHVAVEALAAAATAMARANASCTHCGAGGPRGLGLSASICDSVGDERGVLSPKHASLQRQSLTSSASLSPPTPSPSGNEEAECADVDSTRRLARRMVPLDGGT